MQMTVRFPETAGDLWLVTKHNESEARCQEQSESEAFHSLLLPCQAFVERASHGKLNRQGLRLERLGSKPLMRQGYILDSRLIPVTLENSTPFVRLSKACAGLPEVSGSRPGCWPQMPCVNFSATVRRNDETPKKRGFLRDTRNI